MSSYFRLNATVQARQDEAGAPAIGVEGDVVACDFGAGRNGTTDGFDDFVRGGPLVGRFVEEGEEDRDGRQARDQLGKDI